MSKRLILLTIVLLTIQALCAQNQNYAVNQYTVDDGLPSNECHDIVQDSSGYIWIATDRGLVRWDGYAFKVYGVNEGLSDLSCVKLFKDRKSNIWISTYSGLIFKYVYRLDTIQLYEFDHIRNRINGARITLNLFSVSDEGDVAIAAKGTGQNVITSKGQLIENISNSNTENVITSMFGEIFISLAQAKPEELRIFELESLTSLIQLGSIKVQNNANYKFNDLASGFALNEDTWLLSFYGYNYIWERDVGVSSYITDVPLNDVAVNSSGEILSAELWNEGVKKYQSLDHLYNNDFEFELEDVSATRLLFDRAGGLWVATIDQGIYHLVESHIEKIDERNITLLTKCNNRLYTIEDDYLFSEFSFEFGNRELLPFSKLVRDLCCNPIDNEIGITGINSRIYDIDAGEFIKILSRPDNQKGLFNGHRISMDYDGCYLISNVNGVYRLCDIEGVPEPVEGSVYTTATRYTDVRKSKSGYFISALHGLFEVVAGEIQKLEIGPKYSDIRINDLCIVGDHLLLATGGAGIIVWDGSSSLNVIDQTNGLISNNIEKLTLGESGNLFVITKQGLSILEKEETASKYMVKKNYDARHGLPTNEISDIVQIGDSLLVGTSKGLALIKKMLSGEAPKIKALIEDVEVNNVRRREFKNLNLDYLENDIRVSYKALDYQQYGKIRYRYKLNNANWTETQSTSVSFGSLEPNKYSFQVQAQNIDGVWSDASSFGFIISSAWWNTWWFLTLCLLLFFLLGYLINMFRLRSIVRNAKFEEELRELEMSALRAQMNPHFIFNCLNSIQSYIMNNEKESAMNYLSSFAKLVRKTLNASMDTSITLEEEISMLRTYLDLEQLRFKNRFTYKIEIDRTIDLISTKIPPLLIQPFVENAVIHGVGGATSGGEIIITFKENQGKHLVINIQDNGKGAEKVEKSIEHKSVGMSITSKRLKLLNSQESDNLVVQSEYSEGEGSVELYVKKIK